MTAPPNNPDILSLSATWEKSNWIWSPGPRDQYNQYVWFRRPFDLSETSPLHLAISADSRYRCWINGERLGDGPVRGWPNHAYYDVREIAPDLLRVGENELLVLARAYNCGVFHLLPRAGALRATLVAEKEVVLETDGSWKCRQATEYVRAAPRVSIQMPPLEIVDLGVNSAPWLPAQVVHENVPTGLSPNDVRLAEEHVTALESPKISYLLPVESASTLPTVEILHPDQRALHLQRDQGCGLVGSLEVLDDESSYPFLAPHWKIWINGEILDDPANWSPSPGLYRIAAFHQNYFGAEMDAVFSAPSGADIRQKQAWRLLPMENFRVVADDMVWQWFRPQDLQNTEEKYHKECQRLGELTKDENSFAELFSISSDQPLPWQPDPNAEFQQRQIVGESIQLDDSEVTLEAQQEARWDLERQACGYFRWELDVAEDCVLDLAMVEHVREDGVIQHTVANRNGLRLHAPVGKHSFFSIQRRSGRHVFLICRKGKATIRQLELVENGYPARQAAPFACSNSTLTHIAQAAHRTLRLSMDDVFVDSLYEQTLWVGDARNEGLYALWAYGAEDITTRSIRLAGQSLERLPMVQSQVPSCWENIIPVWSFLWGQSVWETSQYQGKPDLIQECWPWVIRNLRGAAAMLNQDCLFDAPWWNLFEWAHLDCHHRVVLYNTMFFRGAVDAALSCAELMDDPDEKAWLRTLSQRLRHAVLKHRREDGYFPEAIHADGSPTERLSLHTQFLAVLHGIVDGEDASTLLERALDDSSLEPIASPFALQFLYEAMERVGLDDRIAPHIENSFREMTEVGDTLWEALPFSRTTPEGFPTRSHCHGWSCCPLYFLPRTALGLRPQNAGGTHVVCSPLPGELTWAEGGIATPQGPIRVRWDREGSTLKILITKPEACTVELQTNPQLEREGLRLEEVTSTRHG